MDKLENYRSTNNNLNKFLISSVLIIFLSQLFLNIIFFQTNIDEIKPENEIVTCYEKIINLKNSDYEKINFINKDIYVIPDFNNFLCLGKVVDLEIEDNNLNIYIGTNPKVVSYIFIINSVLTVVIFSLLKNKVVFLFITLFLANGFFYLNWLDPNLSSFGKLITLIDFLFPYLLIFQLLILFWNFTNDSTKVEPLIKTNVLDKKTRLFSISSISFLILWFLTNIERYRFYLTEEFDFKISKITLDRINYFDITTIESGWNQHSQLYFKYINILSNFNSINSENNFIYMYLFTVISVYFIVQKILELITERALLSSVFSFIFAMRFSLYATQERVLFNIRSLGILISSLVLLCLINYIKNHKDFYLALYIFFSCLLVFNLESYAIVVLSLFIYLFYIHKNKKELSIKSLFFILLSNIIIYLPLLVNNEFRQFFQMKYLLHLRHTNNAYFGEYNLFGILGEGSYINLPGSLRINHILLMIALFVCFIKIKKFKNNKIYENILIVFFISELFHLFLTGPRWNEYILVVKLSSFLIVSYFVLTEARLFKKINSNILILFITIFLISPAVIFLFGLNDDKGEGGNYGDYFLNEEKIFINSYIEDQEVSNKVLLTWVGVSDWTWLYFEGGYLPSTRFWWWFDMRFAENYQQDLYNWKNWDDTLSYDLFLEDIKKEKPEIAIISKNYKGVPEIVLTYLEVNQKEIVETTNYFIYKLNN